jgi:glycerol-3-phosphate acyltransferase PlsX
MVGSLLKQGFEKNIFTRLAYLISSPVLASFKRRVDHRRHNGAALLGLQGLVFKSHGSADALGFENALNRAYDAAEHGLLDRVHERIARALPLLQSTTSATSRDESSALDPLFKADLGRP